MCVFVIDSFPIITISNINTDTENNPLWVFHFKPYKKKHKKKFLNNDIATDISLVSSVWLSL